MPTNVPTHLLHCHQIHPIPCRRLINNTVVVITQNCPQLYRASVDETKTSSLSMPNQSKIEYGYHRITVSAFQFHRGEIGVVINAAVRQHRFVRTRIGIVELFYLKQRER